MQAEIVPDCIAQNGTSSCYVANNTMQHCMPGTYEEGAKQLGRLSARSPYSWSTRKQQRPNCLSGHHCPLSCSLVLGTLRWSAAAAHAAHYRKSIKSSSFIMMSDSPWYCAAAQHAAAAQHRHHGGIIAGSVIGALAAVAVFAALIAALCTRKERSRCGRAPLYPFEKKAARIEALTSACGQLKTSEEGFKCAEAE